MKQLIKKIVPKFLFNSYHYLMAKLAEIIYFFPSNKMIIVGVTGTKGKTTTSNMIAAVIEAGGGLVGLATTANFRIGSEEWLNDHKMTMLGRFKLQKFLSKCQKAGCSHVVVETSSEGIKQYRHIGINYDLVVFTNLSPEHLESHGGFENYKKAKNELFKFLTSKKTKTLKNIKIPKIIVVNADDKLAGFFLDNKADQKYKYGFEELSCDITDSLGDSIEECIVPHDIQVTSTGTSFQYEAEKFALNFLGKFNIYNAVCALTVGLALEIPLVQIKQGLENIKSVPGRLEFIEEAKAKGFTVIVDYAYEPKSVENIYKVIEDFKKPESKVIAVTGSCGGGRDKARRPILGRLANRYADYVIVTNEDPYDENPEEIIDQVLAGTLEDSTRKLGENVFKVLERRDGIKKALQLATPGDIVILLAKGAEQCIAGPNGTKIPWDERTVARELLSELDHENAK